jgi:hypothetical protein
MASTIDVLDGGRLLAFSIELVTRAVTGDRYVVDPALVRPQRGFAMERFVFELGDRHRAVTLVVREGIVSDEFIELATTDPQEARLDQLKLEMLDLVRVGQTDDSQHQRLHPVQLLSELTEFGLREQLPAAGDAGRCRRS